MAWDIYVLCYLQTSIPTAVGPRVLYLQKEQLLTRLAVLHSCVHPKRHPTDLVAKLDLHRRQRLWNLGGEMLAAYKPLP